MAKHDSPTRGANAGLDAARAALTEGDHRAARRLAEAVLADPAASAQHPEARRIVGATRIDRAPLVAGGIVLVVLVVLFWWALSHAHG